MYVSFESCSPANAYAFPGLNASLLSIASCREMASEALRLVMDSFAWSKLRCRRLMTTNTATARVTSATMATTTETLMVMGVTGSELAAAARI